MGLGLSKAQPRVTPLQSQEAETPSAGPVFFPLTQNLEEKASHPFMSLQDEIQALRSQLPPLRETWYGRSLTGGRKVTKEESRLPCYPLHSCRDPDLCVSSLYSTNELASKALHLDIPLKLEETSIIKRHPPRRIQKFEPIDLPQVITSERLLSKQEARTQRHKAKKDLEKKMQFPMYTSGKRQYFHKMQRLEMNRLRQEELKKRLQSKSTLDMQKLKDHNGNKITQSMSGSNGYDMLTLLPDEIISRDPGELHHFSGKPQDEEFLECHTGNDYCVRKIGKMERWLREQTVQTQPFWDSSSSDMDEPEGAEKRPQALVRTRTERIPRYDEFYDQE